MASYQEFPRRRKPNRRAKILLVFFVIISLAAGILYFSLRNPGVPQDLLRMPFPVGSNHAFLSNGVAYIEGNQLKYMDFVKPKNSWAVNLAEGSMRVAASSQMIVAYNEHEVQAITPTGQSLTKRLTFENSIQSVKCGYTHFAALVRQPDGKFLLEVITNQDKQLEAITFDYGYALDYNFYLPEDRLYTLSINIEGSTPVSTIATFNYAVGETITGIIPIQNELISRLDFDSSNIFVSSTTNLYSFDSTGHEQLGNRQLIYGYDVLDASISEGHSLFLLSEWQEATPPPTTVHAKILTYPSTGEGVDLRLPAQYISAHIYQDKVVALTSNHVYVYDLKGNILRDFALDGNFSAATELDNERLLLQDGSSYYLYTIQ